MINAGNSYATCFSVSLTLLLCGPFKNPVEDGNVFRAEVTGELQMSLAGAHSGISP